MTTAQQVWDAFQAYAQTKDDGELRQLSLFLDGSGGVDTPSTVTSGQGEVEWESWDEAITKLASAPAWIVLAEAFDDEDTYVKGGDDWFEYGFEYTSNPDEAFRFKAIDEVYTALATRAKNIPSAAADSFTLLQVA